VAEIAESVSADLILGERLVIANDCAVIVSPRGDVTEVGWRQRGAREWLKVHD
jgi:hypothetical protein